MLIIEEGEDPKLLLSVSSFKSLSHLMVKSQIDSLPKLSCSNIPISCRNVSNHRGNDPVFVIHNTTLFQTCYSHHLSNVNYKNILATSCIKASLSSRLLSCPEWDQGCLNPLSHIHYHNTIQLCPQDYSHVESSSYLLTVGSLYTACLDREGLLCAPVVKGLGWKL